MPIINKTFRIFVSSTFSDLKEERNALQRDVFPALKKLCLQHGYRFQAIDLRWGIREESALDQQTMNICLDEVARCQRPPNPNFIVLLGDRYGWQPLPVEIPVAEYDQVERQVLDEVDIALLQGWYKRDNNAVPAVYRLQAREVNSKPNATAEEEKETRINEAKDWNKVESRLRQILRTAVVNINLSEQQRIKYVASATELEINAGALQMHDVDEHVFGFFREIDGLPREKFARDYIDLVMDQEEKQLDLNAQKKLSDLKERLRKKVGDENIFNYKAAWQENNVTTDHIEKLCTDVYNSLSKTIKKEIGLLQEISPLQKEIQAHEDLREDRVRHFVGRFEILKKIKDYIKKSDQKALAVCGDSGCGKSALMAIAIQQTRDSFPDAEVISRFIGATPDSSNGRALLEGLCRQISQIYDISEVNIPTDYNELVREFSKRLSFGRPGKKLILFLDALDQLSDTNNARDLAWLPSKLPENVFLIISTLPGKQEEKLKKVLPGKNILELKPMPAEEGEQLLDLWLTNVQRILQPDQKKEVLEKFNQNGLPLYLKLSFEESRKWKSYDEQIKLSADIKGLLYDLYKRLSANENHGEIIVSHSLGFLAASKNGLTEDELIDILSQDKEVFSDFQKRSFHELPEQRLPVVIWSRLYFDIEPYLIERNADGTTLMTFYHRQFNEAAKEKYLSNEDKINRHQALAAYFASQPLDLDALKGSEPNLRKLSELPYQLTLGEQWDKLINTLTDFSFLEHKASKTGIIEYIDKSGMLVKKYTGILHILDDFEFALARGATSLPLLEAYVKTIKLETHNLIDRPDLLWQQFYNRLQFENENIFQILKKEFSIRRKPGKHKWLRQVNSNKESETLVRTFSGHNNQVNACAMSPDGSYVVSAAGNVIKTMGHQTDYSIKVYDFESGAEKFTLLGHTWPVRGCAVSMDSTRIISVAEDCLIVWDAQTGQEISRFECPGFALSESTNDSAIAVASFFLVLLDIHSGEEHVSMLTDDMLHDCAITADGSKIVTAGTDQHLVIWDSTNGEEIAILKPLDQEENPGDDINACAISPDGTFIVSGGSNGIVRIWDAKTFKEKNALAGHNNDVTGCAVSPDNSLVVTADWDGKLIIWEGSTGMLKGMLEGHSGVINDCIFSPCGRYIISGGDDKTMKVWNVTDFNPSKSIEQTENIVSTYTPDGSFRLWDTSTGEEYKKREEILNVVENKGLSADGKIAITAHSNGSIKLTDIPTNKEVFTLSHYPPSASLPTSTTHIRVCEVSRDGSFIVSVSYTTIKIWDTKTGEERFSYKDPKGVIDNCIIFPDNSYVITQGGFQTRVWDPNSGQNLSVLDYNTAVMDIALSPDGSFLLTTNAPRSLKLWDIKKQALINTLSGHEDWVKRCLISPDRSFIASASVDGTARLWDFDSGRELEKFPGLIDEVGGLAVSPDASFVGASGRRNSVVVWDVNKQQEWTLLPMTGNARRIEFHPHLPLLLCDLGDKVYIYELIGIDYEPIIVTPFVQGSDTIIICPACQNQLFLNKSWLGNAITCPIEDCEKSLHINPYILDTSSLKGDIVEAATKYIEGMMYYEKGHFKEAIESLESVLKIQDNHAISHYFLYMAHKQTGNPEKASYHFKISTASPENIGKTDLDKLIETYREKFDKPEKEDHSIPFNQGNKYLGDSKYDEAILSFKEAVRIKPDFAEAYNYLGVAYRKAEKKDEAIDAYKKAIKVKPDYELAYFLLGVAYGSKGMSKEAKEAYKNAIRLNDNDKYAHFNLGLNYKQEGNMAKAKYHFKRALDLGYEEARQFLDKLE